MLEKSFTNIQRLASPFSSAMTQLIGSLILLVTAA
jgi:hypothetical protein